MTPRSAHRFTPPPPPVGDDGRDSHEFPLDLHSPGTPVILGLAALGLNSVLAGTAAHAEQPVVTAVEDPAHEQRDTGVPEESSTAVPSPFWSSQEPAGGGQTGHTGDDHPDATADSPTAPPAPSRGDTFPSRPAQDTHAGADRVVEGTVTVRGGESLWSITADLLGPEADAAQIAATWPELWKANAAQVPDPDLLQAGTVLTVPDSLHPSGA